MSALNMLYVFLTICLAFTLPWSAVGLDNGLALTPPMGWMQWERFRCITDCESYPDECISEKLFKRIADLMVSEGYRNVGYEYIMVDDCWMERTRDEKGRLQGDKTRFPNGMKALGDYIHAKGLKFGIYADYGTHTCAGYPGSIDNLKLDAETFAEWGVDYLKFDGCYSDVKTIEDGYTRMKEYLNATGRPIAFSCSWPAYKGLASNYTRAAEDCNLWRNYGDIDDAWSSVQNIIKWFGTNQGQFLHAAGPGHWNDPDMLIIGDYGLSHEQAKTQMTLWAIMAAPLIMSVDLATIKPEFKKILQNQQVISINQDPLGIQGQLIHESFNGIKGIDMWVKRLSPHNGAGVHAVAIISHRVDGYPFKVDITMSQLGLTHPHGYELRDVYDESSKGVFLGVDEVHTVRVPPTGTALLIAVTQTAKGI